MHLTSSPIDWYAARAAGIAAYIVLTIVLALGLTMSGKARSGRWPKFAVEDVHRFGGLLVGFFVALHVLTVAIDSYLPFSPVQVLVPADGAIPAGLDRSRYRRRRVARRACADEPVSPSSPV